MRVVLLIGLIGLVAAAMQGCWPRAPSLGPTVALDGAEVYERSCASCHGPGGRGDGPVAASLKRPPADLTLLAERNGGTYPRRFVLDAITGRVRVDAHGPRKMPVWSDRFSPTGSGATAAASFYTQRHADLVADHLETLQRTSGGS